jgi:hypothetical protein
MVIKARGGNDRVMVNYLPIALSNATRSWLFKPPKGTIYNWNQPCAMFIDKFQGMHERPSIAETLKTIKEKHDESLRDYVKCFYNTKNAIPNIHDIKIINAFWDGVSDIKNVGEITMKESKTVVDLLPVTDVCMEVSEARA